MSRSARIVLFSLAGVVAVVLAGVAIVAKAVFLPTDCYDHDAVDRLAREPIERVRPSGSELVDGPVGPTCNFIEPRYEEPTRSWTLQVEDPSRVQSVVDDLVEAAERDGWEPAAPRGVGSDEVRLRRRIDGEPAELGISPYWVAAPDETVDAGGIDGPDATQPGSWRVDVSTAVVDR